MEINIEYQKIYQIKNITREKLKTDPKRYKKFLVKQKEFTDRYYQKNKTLIIERSRKRDQRTHLKFYYSVILK